MMVTTKLLVVAAAALSGQALQINQLPASSRLRMEPALSRGAFLSTVVATLGGLGATDTALAEESVGLECDGLVCLGVIDGMLKFCPPGGNACVSSQDDRPPGFTEPWDWSEADKDPESAKTRLEAAVVFGSGLTEQETAQVLASAPRYLHVLVSNKQSGAQDDMEFFFPKNDVTVQLRASRRGADDNRMISDFGANARRLESMRKQMKWTKIPVLRNRRRTLVFLESPFDTFGPVTGTDPETGGTSVKEYTLQGDTDPFAPNWVPPTPEMRRLKKYGD